MSAPNGRDRARARAPTVSGPDHPRALPGIRKSTGGADRTRHRGMATRSMRPPERDRFLESVGALRDLLKYIGRDVSWRLAISGVFGSIGTQIPLPNDTLFARALLFLTAVTLGALVGRRLDRRKHRSCDARKVSRRRRRRRLRRPVR